MEKRTFSFVSVVGLVIVIGWAFSARSANKRSLLTGLLAPALSAGFGN